MLISPVWCSVVPHVPLRWTFCASFACMICCYHTTEHPHPFLISLMSGCNTPQDHQNLNKYRIKGVEEGWGI